MHPTEPAAWGAASGASAYGALQDPVACAVARLARAYLDRFDDAPASTLAASLLAIVELAGLRGVPALGATCSVAGCPTDGASLDTLRALVQRLQAGEVVPVQELAHALDPVIAALSCSFGADRTQAVVRTPGDARRYVPQGHSAEGRAVVQGHAAVAPQRIRA